MKSLTRLWAFLLIFTYVSTFALPAFAQTATLSASPSSGRAPLTTSLSGTAGGQTSFGGIKINFGDGSADETICSPGVSCGAYSVSHQYKTAGSYLASLRSTGEGEGSVLAITAITATQTATGGAGSAGSTAPPTCVLSINPSSVQPGDSATLTWRSLNATGGAITNIGNVPANGSKNIIPPLAATTFYIGSFTGAGGTTNCSASVRVMYGNSGSTDNTTRNFSDTSQASQLTGSGQTDQTSGGGSSNITDAKQPALVQCGLNAFDPKDPSQSNSVGCEACNLAQLVQNSINFLIGLSIPIAAALFAWAGILYFTSGADPANKDRAKKIFQSALIGFLIAISAWLIINTLLHALVDGGEAGLNSGNWFEVKCSGGLGKEAGQRNVTGTINDVINKLLPVLDTSKLATSRSGFTGIECNSGGGCYDTFTGKQVNSSDSGIICDSALGGCYDKNNNFVSGDSSGGSKIKYTLDENGNLVAASQGDQIAASAQQYIGSNTNAGADVDYGNKACAWAVNNILKASGVDTIDGNSVQLMLDALEGGRGQLSGSTNDLFSTKKGDIVVWKNENISHVGICATDQCTEVLSNTSRTATFNTRTDAGFNKGIESRIYHVK